MNNHLKKHITLAKQCSTGAEFYRKARKRFTNVPKQVADWFHNKYNSTGMLAPEKACQEFIEDVERGKYDYITNPFLYRRKEIRF